MPSDPTLAPVDLVEVGHCRVLRDVASQPGIETVEGRLVPLLAGDLFHFVAGVPTGFETPFGETAVILIFKGSGGSYESMVAGMQRAEESLEQMASDGEVFRLDELPETHPARTFVSS